MKQLYAARRSSYPALREAVVRGVFPPIDLFEPISLEFDDQLVEDLQSAAIARFPGTDDASKSELDAFLAPRLHAAFRMPRHVAANSHVWAWIATVPLRKFAYHRWPISTSEPNPWRFVDSNLLRNGASRLWWAAELLRDGPDYQLVADPLRKVYSFQFISELRYSWHKECARAFARVTEDRKLNSDAAKELSKRLNVYLRSRGLELMDVADTKATNSVDEKWLASRSSLPEITCSDGELKGPNDGYSRADVEEDLYTWLTVLSGEIQPKAKPKREPKPKPMPKRKPRSKPNPKS